MIKHEIVSIITYKVCVINGNSMWNAFATSESDWNDDYKHTLMMIVLVLCEQVHQTILTPEKR